jgi:GTP cyclohydrolase IV
LKAKGEDISAGKVAMPVRQGHVAAAVIIVSANPDQPDRKCKTEMEMTFMNNSDPPPLLEPYLPTHSRKHPAFEAIFPNSIRETIDSMDNAGDDIPTQLPSVPLAIRRVGLSRSYVPASIYDPFGTTRRVTLSCAIDVALEVSSTQRGIHVSRIGDIIASHARKEFRSLEEYATLIAQEVSKSHQTRAVSVKVSGVLTYLEDFEYIKRKSSLEHLILTAEAQYSDGRFFITTGCGFTHITACPCVQATYRHSITPLNNSKPVADVDQNFPVFTHSQRCSTHLSISSQSKPPPLSQLLDAIDDVVIRSQNTLPRGIELLNVVQAHMRPQFLEDVLRDLVHSVYLLIQRFSPETRILVESTSMESIHDFDLSGVIEYSLSDLHLAFRGQTG